MRSRRAYVYALSLVALLVPAGGIAYLGVASYRDERGAVTAQNERQRQVALGVVARIDRAIDAALHSVERNWGMPLARFGFSIDPDGKLTQPRPAPHLEVGGPADRSASCSGGLEDCVRELSTRQARIARLRAAEHAEACHVESCGASLAEARRSYTVLAGFADTGPAALLGLARLGTRVTDPKATAIALADLERRFADRTFEELPVPLVVQLMRAEAAGPIGLIAVGEDVLAGRYAIDTVREVGVVARIRPGLDGDLPPELATRRAALDERLASIRIEARMAAGLADDLAEVRRTATVDWQGKAATRDRRRTLVYRKRADGGIVGFTADAAMLEAAAGHESGDDVALHARLVVLAAGASPSAELRTIAQVPLGERLPHLSLALVNPLADPDPLDEVIRTRSRRHVGYTSALVVLLAIGLLATIRGAARARELAQLKSDFVSTVSHELKTPLTSIRMFAEMLEQGVAKGDQAKMARYHGVIVQESQRLGLLIANLLDYAQIERGTRRYLQSRHGIKELAEGSVETFDALRDPEVGGRNPVEVAVSPEAMDAEVEVDRDVVVGAVLNLLANAAKYGGQGAIEVQVGADADAAWIAVRDHGPGIPASEQPRIFREFYRAPEAYRSGVEGTGLGLALVKRHVEALGGTVDVRSQIGQGATFTIRLRRLAAEGLA